MRIGFVFFAICMLSIVPAAGVVRANPDLYSLQPVAGWAENRWSFMTAWNLSSGQLEMSPAFYSGRQVWHHNAPKTQWIGRFIYDQGTGRTSELAWFYSQWFAQ